jgi:TPP-dependent pyruvate/acetoin dehydrogenase alpha subunit
MYRCMVLARLIEERLIKLYHQGKIFGGVYTGVGQEAIGAATAAASEPQDLFSPLIRDMSVHLGRGTEPITIFRQYLARTTSPTRGWDGNVHYGELSKGVYPMISHLGAMLPVLVGAVMARRQQGRMSVGFAYIGDGATSTGDFHEAVNFAAVFDVPVIFVIENNKYAYSTPNHAQYRCKSLADRAAGYGIQGYQADGNDLVALHLLARELAEDIRQKPAPVLLECDTFRVRGHGEHDDASYVPKELREQYEARDPIRVARDRLVRENICAPEDLTAIEKAAQEAVRDALHDAMSESEADPSVLLRGAYAGS